MRLSVADMGLTLHAARTRRKWSVDDLAHRSGVGRATVYRIEAGDITNPSHDTVTRLESALKVRRGTLLFGAEAEAQQAQTL